MKARRLTDTAVRKLSPKRGERIDLSDGVVPGLILRSSGRERKAWSMMYRINGRQRRKTIGYYPAMSLAKARAEGSNVYSQAKMGIDPFAETYNPHRDLTFEDLFDIFMTEHGDKLRKGPEIRRMISNHVLPAWKHLLVTAISRTDARVILKKVEQPSADGLRGGLHAARDIRKWASRVFTWALDQGLVDHNPFERVPMPGNGQVRPRERVLTIEELRVIWEAAGTLGYPFGSMYELLILTGQRLREIAHAEWGWMDIKDRTLNIPGAFYKMRRPHAVPLGEAAWQVVSELPKWNRGPFIFSSTSGKKPISGFTRGKERLDAAVIERLRADNSEAEPLPHWVTHDLRRTVRSNLSRLGVDHVTAELVIGHAPKGVHGIYDKYDRLDERRGALELWSQEVFEDVPGRKKNYRRISN